MLWGVLAVIKEKKQIRLSKAWQENNTNHCKDIITDYYQAKDFASGRQTLENLPPPDCSSRD